MPKNDDSKRKAMPEFAKGLLGDPGADSDEDNVERDEDRDEADENDDEHSGLHVASREMLDATQADDHVAHAKALANFLTIHNKSERGGSRKGEPEED